MEIVMSSNFSKLALALVSLSMAGGVMAAGTDSGTSTMGATANIANECSVSSAVSLAWGTLAMLNAGAQSAVASASTGGGSFDAICTNGTPLPKLRFTSANTGASDFRLVGTDTTSFIGYTLATAADVGINYGADAAFAGFTADGTAKHLTIKGSISAGEKAAKLVQAYSDTITITSSFTVD
jgi:spore coat protein U-like protein